MQMTHTRLLVSDFKECFLFYRDQMEFPVKWGNPESSYADFDANSHILALFGKQPMAEAIGSGSPAPKHGQQDDVCLIFRVEDVDSAYDALVVKGIVTINQPHDRKDWGVRCFHLRDPAGTLIEINKEIGMNCHQTHGADAGRPRV